MVGQNLRYEVGTIIYEGDEGASDNTGAIIGGAVGGIMGALIVLTGAILLLLVVFKRRTNKKTPNRSHQELVETKGGDLQFYIYKFSH